MKFPVYVISARTVILWLLGSCPLLAQTPFLPFVHFDQASGLSQATGTCITQDRFGFIWVGTQDGLNRFDGYNFHAYRHDESDPHSIPGNWIDTLFNDRQGRFFVGTRAGLVYFDGATGHFIPVPLEAGVDTHQHVTSMRQDRQGRYWVGTFEGLFCLNEKLEPIAQYLNGTAESGVEKPVFIEDVSIDSQGAVWLATRGAGLQVIQPGAARPEVVPGFPPVLLCLFAEGSVLWIGSLEHGLFRFDTKSGERRIYTADPALPNPLVDNSVSSLCRDKLGRLWAGTYKGISIMLPKGREVWNIRRSEEKSGLQDDYVRTVFVDAQGFIWVGTQSHGVDRHNPTTALFGTYLHQREAPNSLPGGDLRCITEDKRKRLWIGANSSLSYLDSETGRFVVLDPNMPNNPYNFRPMLALCVDTADQLWIGCINGLFLYEEQHKRFKRFVNDPADPRSISENSVVSMVAHRDGSIWAGTRLAGLNRYDPRTGHFTRYSHDPAKSDSLSGDFVSAVYFDSKDQGWVGTFSNGLNRMRADGGFDHFDERHGLTNPAALCLLEGRDQQLWVGTLGGLFVKGPRDVHFRYIGEQDGLPNEAIYGLLEDAKGAIWASTNNGMARIDPATKKIRAFHAEDGLQGDEFNSNAYWKRTDGRLVYGGNRGLNMFRGEQIPEEIPQLKVVFTDFWLFNMPVPPELRGPQGVLDRPIWEEDHLQLDYSHYVFSFLFSSLKIADNQRVRYAFKMEGFDEEWLETTSSLRYATYTNLPSGTYTFRVKGRLPNDAWSKEEARIRVTVHPPFWRTNLAFVVYGLLAIALIAAIAWNVKRGRIVLERRVADRTAELHRQNEALDNRNRELEGIDHIVRSINLQIEPEAVMQVLTDQVHRLIPGADRVSCFLLDRRTDVYRIVASHGFSDSEHLANVIPRARLEERYAKTTEEVEEGILVAHRFREKVGQSKLRGIPLAEALVAITIVLGGKTAGYVVVDNLSDPEAFRAADFKMLVRLRQHAITALLRARQVADLIAAQKQLADAAHAAGMAESAMDVLHNLGNRLNSVKTSAQVMRELLQRNDVLVALDRFATNLSDEHALIELARDANRRAMLPEALKQLGTRMRNNQNNLVKESDKLDSLLQDVTADLQQQQKATGQSESSMEPVSLSDLVHEALENEIYLLRDKGVQVIERLESQSPVMANRVRLLRVLAYLLENAREAVPNGSGWIVISSSRGISQGTLTIADNGGGIEPGLLDLVFRNGYSTKLGRRGFGLHYCANTIKEMNGHIEITSEGAGKGTRVTLQLPLAPMAV